MQCQNLVIVLVLIVQISDAVPEEYLERLGDLKHEIFDALNEPEDVFENGESTFTENPSCPLPFITVGNQCLYFATFAEQTQQESRQICHSLGAELVSIKTATHMLDIIDHIKDNDLGGKNYWIDGSDEEEEGTWLFTSRELVPKGTPFWMATEMENAPDGGPFENCIAITSEFGYFMNDMDCSTLMSPLCEYNEVEKDAVGCPPFFVDVDGSCIAFIIWADETWVESRQTCHGLSGEHASVNVIELLRGIYEYVHMEGISSHSFWIGGSDENFEGLWRWTNGDFIPTGAPWWGSSNVDGMMLEPDGGQAEDCLALTTEGFHYFRDKNCTDLYNPMCITEPQS
ncbi:hypothetical protein SK128_023043 [Halocaridina rubra]|uniref:C-type lectin domain-containing protein n=1 Tax=Halocaridina rubra TaxID=373956 RepID=A0AAN9A3C2_HALRR